MIQSDRTTFTWRAGTGLGSIGLGLCLLAGLPGAGCSLGTPPELLEDQDATSPPVADAALAPVDAQTTTGPPVGIPPLDRETWDATSTATFALG
jgi:hypothetical protein